MPVESGVLRDHIAFYTKNDKYNRHKLSLSLDYPNGSSNYNYKALEWDDIFQLERLQKGNH